MNKSFKVLAIGNSFSCDAMEYLFRVSDSAGEKNIVLGNLFIPGCTLDIHFANASLGSPVYQYYKNTDGQWRSTMWQTIDKALSDEEWDFITFQQGSGSSGQAEAYSHLSGLVDYVCSKKLPKTKLAWHMTWAYQSDSTHCHFYRYENNQMKMYSAIVSAVKTAVLPVKEIETVIPSGTVIQNLRTGTSGDTLTRDGFHLSIPVGRYAAALTYYCALTGKSAKCVPCDLSGFIEENLLREIKTCVESAIAAPFEVTAVK